MTHSDLKKAIAEQYPSSDQASLAQRAGVTRESAARQSPILLVQRYPQRSANALANKPDLFYAGGH